MLPRPKKKRRKKEEEEEEDKMVEYDYTSCSYILKLLLPLPCSNSLKIQQSIILTMYFIHNFFYPSNHKREWFVNILATKSSYPIYRDRGHNVHQFNSRHHCMYPTTHASGSSIWSKSRFRHHSSPWIFSNHGISFWRGQVYLHQDWWIQEADIVNQFLRNDETHFLREFEHKRRYD